MRRKFGKTLLKSEKRIISIFTPNDIRLSFYIFPIGDNLEVNSENINFNDIKLLNELDTINPDLFDNDEDIPEGNIYALMDEGVLSYHATGADLGIYDYKKIVEQEHTFDYTKYIGSEFVYPIDNIVIDNQQSNLINEDDFEFTNCILAEENALNSEQTKIVTTFKGYLEVTNLAYSIIRKSDCDNQSSYVYIHRDYIDKYQLRNGDEILGTCKEVEGQKILNALFTINQQPRYNWNINRPWFKNMQYQCGNKLKGKGEYTKTIINKFKLLEGDSVFFYINKTSQKNHLLSKLVEEVSGMFEKVIYINPEYKSSIALDNFSNVVKFCTYPEIDINIRTTKVLLAANYAKRMIELGKRVAVIVDDIEAIINLEVDDELGVSKTLLSTMKATSNGSATNFTMVSLRNNKLNSYNTNRMFKSVETVGVVIDNNEIDLFNSYRI